MIFLARFLFFPLAVSGVILSDDDSSLYFSFFETHQILCRIFYTSRSRTATPSAWLCELLGRWCATEAPRQVAALAVWTSRNRCKWLHRRWWWQVYRRSQRSGTFILFQLQLQLPSSSRCAVTFPLGWERRRRRRFFLFKSKAIQQENTTTNGVASLLLLYIPPPFIWIRSQSFGMAQPSAADRVMTTWWNSCWRRKNKKLCCWFEWEIANKRFRFLSYSQQERETGQIFILFWFMLYNTTVQHQSFFDPSNTYVYPSYLFLSLFHILWHKKGECARGRAC